MLSGWGEVAAVESDTVGAADFSAVESELQRKEKIASATRANAPEKENLNDCIVLQMF